MIRFKSSKLRQKKMFCLDQLEKPVKQVSFTDQIPPDIWSVLLYKCIIRDLFIYPTQLRFHKAFLDYPVSCRGYCGVSLFVESSR